MSLFEQHQRRATRQLKVFEAARIIRQLLCWADPRPNSLEARMEEIRIAALSAVAESRATMRALECKGIVTPAEVQDFLDWGYDSILEQVSAGVSSKVQEGGNG